MENKKNEKLMTNNPPPPSDKNIPSGQKMPPQPEVKTPPAPKLEVTKQPQQAIISEQTVEDKSSKSKKIKIGIIVAACVVAVAGLIFLIAGLISNNTKLATPTGLEVVEISNGDIFVYVDRCSGAVKYKFEIENTDSNDPSSIIESTTNVLDITESMSKSATYKITCQYIGKTPKNTSNYCEKKEYTIIKKLATPTVELGKITKIENGKEVQKNVLFCKSENRFSASLFFVLIYAEGQIIPHNFSDKFELLSSGCYSGYFDLDNIFANNKGGQYQLSVQAIASDQNLYANSDISEQVFYKVV